MPKIPPPKGTRDLYPLEAARRRWLTERWRRVAIRHGFEEVDGPTFETTDLYAVKSGEGILNELFQSFSGKDPKDIERIRAGEAAPFAMRPEFTPSLAPMYAERARTLPSPCKWFQLGPFFRAERPQRGRLREFLQWNVDMIGFSDPTFAFRQDVELMSVAVDFLIEVGLSSKETRVRFNHRDAIRAALKRFGVADEQLDDMLVLLDCRSKIAPDEFERRAEDLGLPHDGVLYFHPANRCQIRLDSTPEQIAAMGEDAEAYAQKLETPGDLFHEIMSAGIAEWCDFDNLIVRGLAYYTGTVFEVIADGERAVAGGGRYDNLIELFGGPPTPAVGFAMGDVVISLLLQDKGLMPSDAELMEEIGARPDAFVIAPNEELDPIATRLLATLRRSGLHARRSYKTTRNVGKLLKEASQNHARIAIIIESPDQATVKNLDASEQHTVELQGEDPSRFDVLLDAVHACS